MPPGTAKYLAVQSLRRSRDTGILGITWLRDAWCSGPHMLLALKLDMRCSAPGCATRPAGACGSEAWDDPHDFAGAIWPSSQDRSIRQRGEGPGPMDHSLEI
ncbi:hypothetical protein E4U17_001369 [Claviceps sp. LM77 group G4]|nr:hypothetical protein E4U17_001369 [Claviceps sp. LM77 group G4]